MKATHTPYVVGFAAAFLLLVSLVFSGCSRCGDSPDPPPQKQQNDGVAKPSPAKPKRATPRPIVLDAKKRKPRPTPPWHANIRVWATQTTARIGDGDTATEQQLVRAQRLLATGLEGDRVRVVLPSGGRATVPFCATDLGLIASQFTAKKRRSGGQAAALPASVRMAAAKAYQDCIASVASDPTRAVVLQGPLAVASEAGKTPGPNAPRVSSWQILDVLEADRPDGFVKVRTAPGKAGFIDRHHVAVGGEPGFEWFASPHGAHLTRYLNAEKTRLDFWFVLHGFARMIPTAIDASQDDDSWKSGWRDGPRQLERMLWDPPVARFLWQESQLRAHLNGEWMPARDAELTQCSQLGMRLLFADKTLRITATDGAFRDHKLGDLSLHANATATVSGTQKDGRDVVILYWIGESQAELITEWMIDPLAGHLVPQTWVPVDPVLEARINEAARKRLNCQVETPQEQTP